MKSKLAQIMKHRKISIRELVMATGLSSATIVKARDDRISECRVSSLKKIASALNISVHALFENGMDSGLTGKP